MLSMLRAECVSVHKQEESFQLFLK